jgi:hypothetical protein
MRRYLIPSLVALTLASTAAFSQDGPLHRAGRALDDTGKNIRARVEGEVVRGEVIVQERDLLGRVSRRIEWDKQLVGTTLQMEVRPDGTLILRGSVISDAAKLRAVDLVTNTIGVARVVDELAVAKGGKVIEAAPPTIELPLLPAEPQTGDEP